MKILLQHKETSLFFQKLETWTTCYRDAFDFKQARKAIEFVNLYDIAEVRILVVTVNEHGRMHMVPFDLPENTPAAVSP